MRGSSTKDTPWVGLPSAAVFSRRGVVAGGVLAAIGLAGQWSCGGASGREGLPGASSGDDASVDGGVDGTVATSDDGGATVDVTILYADENRLPHFEASVGDGGGDAAMGPPPGADWPPCACDVSGSTGLGVAAADSGSCAAAPRVSDSGAFASDFGVFTWGVSPACIDCLRGAGQCSIPGSTPAAGLFPPCCDLPRDAAASGALAGPPAPAGSTQFEACAALWTCLVQHGGLTTGSSGPGAGSPQYAISSLFCGEDLGHCEEGAGANGPCAQETLNAFESTKVPAIAKNPDRTTAGPGQPGYAGFEIYNLVECAANYCSDLCGPLDAGAE